MIRVADLSAFADRYFELLAAGDHKSLPAAPGVRFTENGQELALGRGLWRTATGAAAIRAMTLADPERQQVATWGMAREADVDVILGLRLRVDDELITEIETLVYRPGNTRLLNAENLSRPTPGFLDPVPDAKDRPTRQQLLDAANGYLDGVSGAGADAIPVADDTIRIENGVQTVLNPEGKGLGPGQAVNDAMKVGVAEQVRRGFTRHIAAARERRCFLTDTERGLVFVNFFFDHDGKVRGWQGRAPVLTPNSMAGWEVFKVSGGLIRHIEAIISTFPYRMRSGW